VDIWSAWCLLRCFYGSAPGNCFFLFFCYSFLLRLVGTRGFFSTQALHFRAPLSLDCWIALSRVSSEGFFLRVIYFTYRCLLAFGRRWTCFRLESMRGTHMSFLRFIPSARSLARSTRLDWDCCVPYKFGRTPHGVLSSDLFLSFV
jgi:hypothetical protein